MINIVKYNIINKMDKILAEISIGELVDKISILLIKQKNINDKSKILHVNKELDYLKSTLEKDIPLMKESVRPFISLPFVKRVQIEGEKGRVISVAEKGNQKKLKLGQIHLKINF